MARSARNPSTSGSSPLARGLHGQPASARPARRIIPARAGFTERWESALTGARDHPRSRGVYSISQSTAACMVGSSPLARGLPRWATTRSANTGIIPARAGFTTCDRTRRRTGSDHPRSRGVYPVRALGGAFAQGSSPLARGLLADLGGGLGGGGIIPARAGFTLLSAGAAQAAADHPRSRGVYTPRPPLVRRSPRIIPARAGFTLLGRRNALTPEDHPRSRGVYSLSRHMLHSTKGSSPLARGLPSSGCCSRPHDRIIPARAGFTIPSFGYPKLSPDHPRSRGVYPTT